MKTGGLKGILFDNDGTVADTLGLVLDSFKFATDKVLGKQLPDKVLMKKVGIPLVEQMEDFAENPDQVQELVDSYREFNHFYHDERIALFEGEKKCLEILHDRGFKMAVVTSKRHELAQHGIEVLGIDDYFEFLIGAEDTLRHKPDADPLIEGCRRFGLQPFEVAYVGDASVDMMAANAAGCLAIGVMWGNGSRDELAEFNPYKICDTYEELGALLLSLR